MFTFLVLIINRFSSFSLYLNPQRSHSLIAFLPDTSYDVSGENALGNPSGGSRITQWGWNAVGLNNSLELIDINNELLATGEIGTVTVTTT